MTDTIPVNDRIPIVGPDGKLTGYGLDLLRGFERAIGGPGVVSIPTSDVVSPAENELVRFNADGNLESTGMIADSDLTLPAGLIALEVDYPGKIERFEATVGQAALASGGSVSILPALTGEQWSILEIVISGTGTNFSGGDRLLNVSQGATVYTSMTTTLVQTLTSTRWGDTDMPLPVNPFALTAAGQDVVAKYSGGSTDYTAGQCTISLVAARL